ncbi:MAG: hexitol phosphatase HxpB [Chitinophagaceae bacterium]|nr:hexitol phosphatase HxpB [Chitinophagaceae bacterium]
MPLNTVIFDMDGVLIDSEPFWEEAGKETLALFDIALTPEEYISTTGLRTREWIDWWFTYFNVDKRHAKEAESSIVSKAIEKIRDHAVVMPGVNYIFEFFRERNFIIGLATSSPVALIDVVTEKLRIRNYIKEFSSAEELPHSKPHPQVYLNCAEKLNVSPLSCVCFEDSFNGMIAARAARMKCVVVPAPLQQHLSYWSAANFKIESFHAFDETVLEQLQ